MARPWDKRQTSSQEEEDLELEGFVSPASKRERTRRVRDWSSSEEDLEEEEPFEDQEVEEKEKTNTIPIESLKVITIGDRLDYMKNTPIIMGKCGFSNCTIHELMGESQEIDPKVHKGHTISARITVGPPRKRRTTNPMPSAQPEVHANNSKLETKVLTEQIREKEVAIIAKTRETLSTNLTIITDQDEMLHMYRSRITDLEVANKLMIDALTGVTKLPSDKNTGTNKKETK